MFRRSRKNAIRDNAASAAELTLQLAQDKKFRQPLLSAVSHAARARGRSRRGTTMTAGLRRFAHDQALRAELSRSRADLQVAYDRLQATQRRRRRRRITLIAGASALVAVPKVRQRAQAMLGQAPKMRGYIDALTPWEQVRALPRRAQKFGRRTSSITPRPLEELTKDELYARAQEADIPGRSEMSKAQLIDALRERS